MTSHYIIRHECFVTVSGLKARSHGAIFLFATAMQKMDCVDVNEGVHMVRFHVRGMHWYVWCHTWLGSTPILCDCDVWFQCKYIENCIQTHRTLWTKSLNRKQHSISWYNKSQSHIAPRERALKRKINSVLRDCAEEEIEKRTMPADCCKSRVSWYWEQ